MPFDLQSSIEILRRTPAILDVWLRGLPDEWLHATEGGESWSAFDMIGHFIHGEKTDWISRARIILEHGEERAFEPCDRFAQFEDSKGKTASELLDEFAVLRAGNVQALEELGLGPEDLERTGRHPELGAVTLAQLLSAWTVHDLGHLRQIARVMAKRYGDEIGPWREYLPVVSE